MDSQKRLNVENDRLSSLPDDLISQILSFVDIKDAVKTCVLSPRWKFIRTSIPTNNLSFSSDSFSTLPKFYNFFTHVLSCSSVYSQAQMSLNLRGNVRHCENILRYAFSHNLQRLTFTNLSEEQVEFFLNSLYSCQSLKHLTLCGYPKCFYPFLEHPLTWDFPALTTLHLSHISLVEHAIDKSDGIFSKFTNLKNLTLSNCFLFGSPTFTICHHQLKKLTVIDCCWEHMISAPAITSLLIKSQRLFVDVDADIFPLLEKVDLCFHELKEADALKIVDILQKCKSVKFLTLGLEIIKLLSSHVELISHQTSPFANLKSLEIVHSVKGKEVKMCTQVKNYLLDGSPTATLTMVPRDD